MNRNETGDIRTGMEMGAMPERFRPEELPQFEMPFAGSEDGGLLRADDLTDGGLPCADDLADADLPRAAELADTDFPDADLSDADIMKSRREDADRESMELPQIVRSGGRTENTYSPLLTAMIKEQTERYAPTMELQAEKIKDIYDTASELHYENWKFLDIDERKKALNNFERGIAAVEKRPPMPVEYEKLSDGHMGYNDGKKMVIAEKLMISNDFSDYKEAMNTLFHEGRHSYQNYNLDVCRTEKSDELFGAWKANQEKVGYMSGNTPFPFNMSESFRQQNFYKYYTQPVEVDARLFAETVENKLGLNAGGAYA